MKKTFAIILSLLAVMQANATVPVPTTVWTDGAFDQMWSSAANWNSGVPISSTAVQIGTQPTGDQIGIDTGAGVTVVSFTFNNTLVNTVDIAALRSETLQVNGAIVNNSAFTDSFSLPVRAGASAVWSGPLNFTGGVNIGGNTITLANAITFGATKTLEFDITNTNSYGRFAGAGVATVSGATINIGGTYTGNGGDTFDFTSGNFSGATLGTLPTLSGGLSWNTNQFLISGILSVVSTASSVLYVANQTKGTIETYNPATGALIKTNFVTGLTNPWGVTVDASLNTLYVADLGSGGSGSGVKAYNATSGASIFTLTMPRPIDVQVSGPMLYVSNYSLNKIGTYNATNGAVINAAFIPINASAQGIILSGGEIFTANNSGSVSAYNASTGTTVSNPLVTGLSSPEFITSSAGALYVTDSTAGKIRSYNPTTGAAINSNLVSLSGAFGVTYFNNALYATVNKSAGTITAYDLSGNPLAGFTTISNPGNYYSGLGKELPSDTMLLTLVGRGCDPHPSTT